MRPSSSTWRSSSTRILLFLVAVSAATARAEICLPPVFEGGRRLVFDEMHVGSLNLLLRQHEVCWRSPASPDERRVFVLGNSSVLGFPHGADDTAIEILNRRFAEDGVAAHLFNLGFVYTYNLKDTLILREALRYEPDVIVLSVMLNDLVHVAPLRYLPIVKFFNGNSREVERFANEAPTAMGEPFALWRDFQADEVRGLAAWRTFRDAGRLVRIATRNWALDLRRQWFPDMPPTRPPNERDYECDEAVTAFEERHADWQAWNPLAYLEQVRAETGAEILVVNWPAARNPQGRCFNHRYTFRALRFYRNWIAEQARSRGFHFVDLQPDFPQDEFFDSIHPSTAGQVTIARLIEPHLRELLVSVP